MEPEQELGDGGLAAAGAADDGGGLAPAQDKVQVLEGGLVGVGKAEPSVLEGADRLPFRLGQAAGAVGDLRPVGEDGVNPLQTDLGPGQEHEDHLGHHHIEEDEHRVLGQGGDVPDLHKAPADAVAPQPEDGHHAEVQKEDGQALQHEKQGVGLDGRLGVVGEGAAHPPRLPRGLVESPDHPGPGDVLPDHHADPVQKPLGPRKDGRGPPGHQHRPQDHHQGDADEQQPHDVVDGKGHEHPDDAHEGHRQHHLHAPDKGLLDHVHVVEGAGNHGARAKPLKITGGEGQGLVVQGVAHVPPDPGGEPGAQEAPH